MDPSPSSLPLPFICPENYTCSMSIDLTQNIPANHIVTMNMIILVIAIIGLTIVLCAFAYAINTRVGWRR